jgi:hypothetical protein
MITLKIDPTEDTPSVIFDPVAGRFEITGRSYPENARDFYLPVAAWLEEYRDKAPGPINLVVAIDYFNSSSVKQVFMILYIIEDIMEAGQDAKITWKYKAGDELMHQKGLEFNKFLQVLVELKEI